MLDAAPMLLPVSACALGFASGVRHAIEPDHLAAVATLVAGEKSARGSAGYAAVWGAGHATTLAVAAGGLAWLGAGLPDRASDVLELAVAATLVALGIRALFCVARRRRVHAHPPPSSRRIAFGVGLVHGLAGSGALAAIVASRLPSPALAAVFILLYAGGAAAGMSALAGLLGVPLGTVARSPRGLSAVLGASAALSLVVGLAWAAPIVARLGAGAR